MSAAAAKVKALKGQLSQLAASHIQSIDPSSINVTPSASTSTFLLKLNTSLAILSAPTHTSPSLDQIARFIIELNQAKSHEPDSIVQSNYAKELEWLFLARCTVDVYGCLLQQLFEQTLPLAQDIFYWEDVLSNPIWRLLFLIQSTYPLQISLSLEPPAPTRVSLY
jgi:nuclear control of ATPase protein 2